MFKTGTIVLKFPVFLCYALVLVEYHLHFLGKLNSMDFLGSKQKFDRLRLMLTESKAYRLP